MNRSNLVESLAAEGKLSVRRAEAVVDLILTSITEALAQGDRIEVRNFGIFITKAYRARSGRNPRTGATIDVPAKRLPAFKAGKLLRESIDQAGPDGG